MTRYYRLTAPWAVNTSFDWQSVTVGYGRLPAFGDQIKGSAGKCDDEFDRCYVRYEYGEKMTGGGENATTVCK